MRHRWINRFRQEGHDGLWGRSSRPHHCPRQIRVEVEEAIVATRRRERRGQDWIGSQLEVPARTVARVPRRHGVPYRANSPLNSLPRSDTSTDALRQRTPRSPRPSKTARPH
ncbi:helix-turn-helix domain-containing protein [Janibacter cremeus]|uniref:helix-turn-helix domain-containing protein n=1 Tax=Janibacter cremeus TaxID=1285192 RepID=UPI00163D602E